MGIRTYLPNSSGKLALIEADNRQPHPLRARMKITQLVGGKRWSLAIITFPKKESN